MQKVGNIEGGWNDRSETNGSPNVFQRDMLQEKQEMSHKDGVELNEERSIKREKKSSSSVKKPIYKEEEIKELKYKKRKDSTYSNNEMIQNGSRLKTEESNTKRNRSYKRSECRKENIHTKDSSSRKWPQTHRCCSPNNYYRRNAFQDKMRYHKPYYRERQLHNYRNNSPRGYKNGLAEKRNMQWINKTVHNERKRSFDRWRKREKDWTRYPKDNFRNVYKGMNHSNNGSVVRKRRRFEEIGRYEGYYKKRQIWKNRDSSRSYNKRNRKRARLSRRSCTTSSSNSSDYVERNMRKEKRRLTNDNARNDSGKGSIRISRRRNYKRLKSGSSSRWEKRKRKRDKEREENIEKKKRIGASKEADKDATDEIIHFSWEKGMILDGRYLVLRKMGDGTFGRVLLCEHIETKKQFAIKVIRNIIKYTKSAKIEADILGKIQTRELNNNNVVKFYGRFMFRDHMCLIFERLGPSFYEILSKNHFYGLHIQDIKLYCIEILKALQYLRKISLIHTDLKPENILLDDPFFQKRIVRVKRPGDGKSIEIVRTKSTGIRIIDFGSAIFDHEYHGTIINTRQYRAPEVILNLGWDISSDMWSLGCVLVELYTGSLLFKTHEHMEHLALMETVIQSFPKRMILAAMETNGAKYINREELRLAWPEKASSSDSIRRVKKCLPLYKIIHHELFCDFLYSILQVDPKLRPTPYEALQHEFFSHDYEH